MSDKRPEPGVERALLVLQGLHMQEGELSPGQLRLRAHAVGVLQGEGAARSYFMEAAEAGDREAIQYLNEQYG